MALSFFTLFSDGFSNMMDRPLSRLIRGVEFLIARLITEHLMQERIKFVALEQ